MSDITNAELARRIDANAIIIKDEIRAIHRRLDDQAQEVNAHAVRLAVQEAQALQRPAQATAPNDVTAKPLTRWDLTVFVAGAYLLVEWLPKLRALVQ